MFAKRSLLSTGKLSCFALRRSRVAIAPLRLPIINAVPISFFMASQTSCVIQVLATWPTHCTLFSFNQHQSRVSANSSALSVSTKKAERNSSPPLAYHSAVGGDFGVVPALFDRTRLYIVEPGVENDSSFLGRRSRVS